jgi:leucyl-tRNA synthetase
VVFPVVGGDEVIEVFTTRPDTLFGATFMVVAPENTLAERLAAPSWPEGTPPSWTGGQATPAEAVAAYQRQVGGVRDIDRMAASRQKTGVFTGAYAVNPVNGQSVPVFAADYVLGGYGTGSIMAVPAHSSTDFAFAQVFGLPVVQVVEPPGEWDFGAEAFEGDGVGMASSNGDVSLDGLPTPDAKARIIEWLDASGKGRGTISYRLRDWLFSRQRYWGEPFPVVYDEDGNPRPLPESMLPVLLPDLDNYEPETAEGDDAIPEPPLARAKEWLWVELDLGDGVRRYRRETNTMPQWAGSCWYYLRYLDPDNDEAFVDPEVERYWMAGDGSQAGGVDLYVGGVEHAVLHLLYARFWHKVLFDLGHVSTPEPFQRLFNQGYIQAYAYTDERGVHVEAAEVVEGPDGTFLHDGQPVHREYGKMGKSLKNVVTPDDMYTEYGADTLRLYEMFMGPLEASRPWDTRAVVGVYRLLQRVWRLLVDEETGEVRVGGGPLPVDSRRVLHQTIDHVRRGMEHLRFNTSIARITELVTHLTGLYAEAPLPREAADALVLMLAPLAPHVAEELWEKLGHAPSVALCDFPTADPELLVVDRVEVPVQVNGKVRATVSVDAAASEDDLVALARAVPKVAGLLEGKAERRVIVVPGRLVNFVVS